MKNKKLQIILLVILLVAVLVGGIYFLTRSEDHDALENLGDSTNPSESNSTNLNWLTDERVQYRTLDAELQKGETMPFYGYSRFWLYEGQLCQLTYQKADGAYALTSMEDGTTLKTYERDCFAGEVNALSLDAEGNLWAIYSDFEQSVYRLGQCEPGKALAEAEPLSTLDAQRVFPTELTLWEDYAVIQYQDESFEQSLAILNRSDGSVQTIGGVNAFCVDNLGNLYCLSGNTDSGFALEKHSMKENRLLWSQTDLPFNPASLWYLDGGGLFLLSGLGTQQKVTAVEEETGALGAVLLDIWTDTDLGEDFTQYRGCCLGIGGSGRICLSVTDYNLNEGQQFCNRYTWCLEPFVPEVDPADMITLTITAPYPVDSMMGSVRMYQRQHPEVQVVWDTQYISREEYQANALQYREQLATRTMTGDTGDLQMIVGAGLAQEVITDTDAFMDLAPYLEQCSFKEELEWNLIETLRGKDDAIRALPLGIVPTYLMYNETLLQSLGNPIDPDTVTWSQLLDLALQWKEAGTNLSLTSCSPGDEENARVRLLTDLLLANLYGFGQEDGTVALDQPYFRELLQTLKALWDSPQLICSDGNYVVEGFFRNSLFASVLSNVSYSDRLGIAIVVPEREDVTICAAPLPWGEICKKQQSYAFCWGIPASSEHQEAAWDLLAFLISSEGLPDFMYSRDTAALNNAAQEGAYQEYLKIEGKECRTFFDQLQALRQLPISRFDEPYGWRDAVLVPIQDYLDGNATLDEAFSLATANWERLLKG